MLNDKQLNKSGFTIVELLVVIVVIGILAAITVVSYTNISGRAVVALLKSDLTNNANLIKLYSVEYGAFPSALDGSSCPTTPNSDTKYCLKQSSGTTLTYYGSGTYFVMIATNRGISYQISEGGLFKQVANVNFPILTGNSVSSITSSTANLSSFILGGGGSTVTSNGICWGTTPNPTSNCSTSTIGDLTAMSTPSIPGNVNPLFIRISPDGKTAYSASNPATGRINIYTRDTSTGILTYSSNITVGTTAYDIAISPDSKNLYLTSLNTANLIYTFNRNISDGTLTANGSIATGTNPESIVISPDGAYLYVANMTTSSISMYSRNTSTGVLASIGTATTGLNFPYGMAISPDGSYIYASNTSGSKIAMFSRNSGNGLLTSTGVISGSGSYRVVISADGSSLYTANLQNDSISMFSRNISTGALTALATPTIATTQPYDITISPDGTSVYVVNGTGVTSMFSRETSTGALSAMANATIGAGTSPMSITVSADGLSVYATADDADLIYMYNRNNSLPTGSFTKSTAGLPAGTTIYYRGFATNSYGTTYTDDSTFVTLP